MSDIILLNNKPHSFTEGDLPCLIHYTPKVGGSHFTVVMIADLFLQGSKILFFTAYTSAKDNLLEQLKGEESKIAFVTDEGGLNTNQQLIIMQSGNESLFLRALEQLTDISERVVLIKNIEAFSEAIFDPALRLNKIIVSGDIDSCPAKEQVSKKHYNTKILFSTSQFSLGVEPPALEKYIGHLWSQTEEGRVSIDQGIN